MDTGTFLTRLCSGALIGVVLGLVGGGGSILAVPLLVYVVRIGSTHAAIGTAAVSVALNALAGLIGHAHAGRVKWRCAGVFTTAGVTGAILGAELGKAAGERAAVVPVWPVDDRRRPLDAAQTPAPRGSGRQTDAGKRPGAAAQAGIDWPWCRASRRLFRNRWRISHRPGTDARHPHADQLCGRHIPGRHHSAWSDDGHFLCLSGIVDWTVTALLIAGGVAGTAVGIVLGRTLTAHKDVLERGFALVTIAVGIYVATSTL